jgi:hypothetical protein
MQQSLAPGYNEIRISRGAFSVALVDPRGTGVYNMEYVTRTPLGEIVRTWRDAHEKIPKEIRLRIWPDLLRDLSRLFLIADVHKILRRQPNGTEDHPRHHDVTAALERAGYRLERDYIEGFELHRLYVKDARNGK